MRRELLAVGLVVALTAAACAGGSSSDMAATTGAASTPSAMRVLPYGVRGELAGLQVEERDVEVSEDATSPGQVVLEYELQLGFDARGRDGIIDVASATTDGQLEIDVECERSDCSFEARPDLFQTSIRLTVRRTDRVLEPGEHLASFAVFFDSGRIEPFEVAFLADPGPSEAFAEQVAASTGAPALVQTVPGIGRFVYDAISAFDSIWVLAKGSRTVTRIDDRTGAVLATIDLEGLEPNGTTNRLAAGDDAIWLPGKTVIRIDAATNKAERIEGPTQPAALVSDGTSVWTASYRGPIERIDADGTVDPLDLPEGQWVDMAISNGLVWVIEQRRGTNRLIAFDAATGTLRHDVPIDTAEGFPVRLVADERSVVIGIDAGLGAGRMGELRILDPATAEVTDEVALPGRPEGIVLTPQRMWAGGAVVDRTTLDVTATGIEFTVTAGPDGSIWALAQIPGLTESYAVVQRWAPGDLRG